MLLSLATLAAPCLTTMSSSHHTAKNIFHVEKYLMQTIGRGQTLHGTGAGSWCHHEAGLETAGTEAGDEAACPAPGLGPAEARCGGHEEAGPDTCHPSRRHGVTLSRCPCSHNITYYANCPLQVSTSSSLGFLNGRTFSTFCCLRRISKMSWADLWMWYWDKKYAKFGVFLNTNCFILKRNWLCGFHDFW